MDKHIIILIILKLFALAAALGAVIVGSFYMNIAFRTDFRKNSVLQNISVRLFFAGFVFFLDGFFLILMEMSSFIQCTNACQTLINKLLVAPFWLRGIIYILIAIPPVCILYINTPDFTYEASFVADIITVTVLMMCSGMFYIIVSFFVKNTSIVSVAA